MPRKFRKRMGFHFGENLRRWMPIRNVYAPDKPEVRAQVLQALAQEREKRRRAKLEADPYRIVRLKRAADKRAQRRFRNLLTLVNWSPT